MSGVILIITLTSLIVMAQVREKLLDNAEMVDVSIYELIKDKLSINKLIALMIRVDSEVVNYILNNCSEDLLDKLESKLKRSK